MDSEPYRQVLPELALSLERLTDGVPADGYWYILKADEIVGRFRSLKAAQAAWRDIVHKSGWTPERLELDSAVIRRREQVDRWSRNRAG